MRSDLLGYFKCENEGCDFKAKRVKSLIYFKGKRLCPYCKRKASKSLNYISKDNPKESSLKKLIKLDNLPKAVEEIKSPLHRDRAKEQKFSKHMGLTNNEIYYLKQQFAKEGLEKDQIMFEIEKIKDNIKRSHSVVKEEVKKNKPSFKESFEELVDGN